MTTEKQSDQGFDLDELLHERGIVDTEITNELEKSSSVRAEALMLTNYVENILKDCMVLLIGSKKARDMKRENILDILKEKKLLEQNMVEDVKKIFKIRDQFGHTMRLSLIVERIEPIIEKMEIVKLIKEQDATWDTWKIDEKVVGISFRIIGELQNVFTNILPIRNTKEGKTSA